ncbi:MAG: RNA polymerase sigma-70 factor [Bacteroidales bacterium]|jgi:RNA polymerase sigma-70 factor (ECF subfamily)|nr:RNA polymerase sigma-70 factor [Bacteroidales bacterium]
MINQLPARIRMGDTKAFELLFRTHYPALCSFANKYLFCTEESQDVVQDVFIKLWENRCDITPGEPLKAWLYKAVANSSISRLRHRKVRNRYDEILKLVYVENSCITPHDTLLEHELSEHLSQALNRIPPQSRRIFSLSRTEGLKYGEIAEILKISVKTVEGHMSKALAILRTELKDRFR